MNRYATYPKAVNDPDWWDSNRDHLDYEQDGNAFHGSAKATFHNTEYHALVSGHMEGPDAVIDTVEDVEKA
jgi:hypothetical protein